MTKIVTIPYKPHTGGQKQLHGNTSRFKTVVCGRRWGKTIFAVNGLIKAAIVDPGPYWYIAPTYKQAKLIAWEICKHYAVKDIRKSINEQELSIDFYTGGELRLMGSDNEDSLRGTKLKGCVFDEFADIKRSVWSAVVRPMLADYRGWAVFMGTPKGKINHLYEMFIRDARFADNDYRSIDGSQIEPDPDFKSYRFKTIDNPYIDPAEIEKARLEMSPALFAQEFEASFENYTGVIYKEFEPAKHVIGIAEIERQTGQRFIKDWWKVYVGIDTGRHTAVSFIAIDDKGNKYVFSEIYDYDGVVTDIAAQIKNKLKRWGIAKATYIIDSASQVKREYERAGIWCIDSEKDVENQIAQVRTALANDELYFNADECPMHIVEHKGYVWDEKAKKPQPVKENDHTCNSVQYVFSTYLATRSKDIVKENTFKKTLLYQVQQNNARKGIHECS